MESVRDLLSFFLKVAAGLFVIVLVIWLTKSVPHSSSKTSTASSTPKVDILPSPRKYTGFFTTGTSSSLTKTREPQFKTFSYSGPIAFSSSSNNVIPINNSNTTVTPINNSNSYNTYTSSQTGGTALQQSASGDMQNVRNLSIYQGGHVYTGLSFVGEARSGMFRDGKFPIVIVDATGRLIGISAAVAQTNWTVPGWVRFETKITYPLPVNVPCTMIFEEALTQAEKTRQPLRVPLPIRCN